MLKQTLKDLLSAYNRIEERKGFYDYKELSDQFTVYFLKLLNVIQKDLKALDVTKIDQELKNLIWYFDLISNFQMICVTPKQQLKIKKLRSDFGLTI